MFKKILSFLFKDLSIFSCAYSNNIFPDPLSKEEESKYIMLLDQGDKHARDMLIEHNLRLVAHIVKKYDSKSDNMDDLISIGTIGLIKGIDSYSSNKNIKLTTYVAKCIENEVLMFFRGNKKNAKTVSLNEPIGFDKDGNEITLMDVLKTSPPDFAMDIHNQDNIKLLKKYFSSLNNKEKNILIQRFGLNNGDEITQKEIANSLGISRSYVSRIEKRAITKILREFIKNKKEV
ncbi:MAG: RNA polymerase sporulation sigma factor SigK [Bacilli bacterium]